ncbi:MAG: beta-mannosidase [Saprospiraceae bacterium]|jgi:beta-mannosidase
MRIPLLVLLIIILGACQESPNKVQSLNGVDWQFVETGAQNWERAEVPGTVQTDLLRLGKIPDPFLLNNEDSIQWVSERDWTYKKTFSVSSEILKRQHHILTFEGLDTYAQVILNDVLLFKSDNAFRSYDFDVSEIIELENTLEIRISSPDTIETKAASILKYQLPAAPRVFSRKPQFQYGWDWGPKIKTMGIWRGVSLFSYAEVRMTEAFIKIDTISEEKATLTAEIEFETFDYDKNTVEIINNATNQIINSSVEIFGKNTYKFPITIKNPKLWWTHNLGDPFLYDFTINLKKGNTVIQTINKKVGLRTIELVTEKDSVGEGFYFKLNGKPVYMKGANYIPQNIFLAEVQPQDRRTLLEDVEEANMNMLRVWGGGVYEDDLFYDLCDEKGILVWQDFMFACAMYPGDKEFLHNVKQEAIANVKRLRNHPSIALWCGNNENSEGWHRWGWQTDKTEAQKEEIWNSYQAVFNDILPKVIDSLHSGISYWESSPKFGRGDARYQFEGDAHDWGVWHDGYPFEHFEQAVPRFMSEFGFQSFPSYEAIKYFTAEDSIDLHHPSFKSHQKHARGFTLIKEYMERDFLIPSNDEDYVYMSQLLQAYGITKGIKAHRLAKPYNMGTLYWQLNDCWPVVSWSSIDGLANWKALHYKVKEAFEDVIIITKSKDSVVEISIVNDTFETVSDTLKVTLLDFQGHLLDRKEVAITTTTLNNELVFNYTMPEPTPKSSSSDMVLKVTFGTKRSLHYFTNPKNLHLPKEQLDISQTQSEKGTIYTITSKTLQKNVYLYTDNAAHFSDNFFDLLPGETKEVSTDANEELPNRVLYKTLNGVHHRINPTP